MRIRWHVPLPGPFSVGGTVWRSKQRRRSGSNGNGCGAWLVLVALAFAGFAELTWQTPTIRWSVMVPVREDEQKDRMGYGNTSDFARLFLVRHLRIHEDLGRVTIKITGLNRRQDGELGSRSMRLDITREDAKRDFPRAWAAARNCPGTPAWTPRHSHQAIRNP